MTGSPIIYVPLILPILTVLPYAVTQYYNWAHRTDALDLSGFAILQESLTIDLRLRKPGLGDQNDSLSSVHIYSTMKVRKEVEQPGHGIFRYRYFKGILQARFRFPRQDLRPKLRRACSEEIDGNREKPGQNDCWWEISCDFTDVPEGEWRDILAERRIPCANL